MAWIGWEVGMTGPTVQAAKRKLKAKFSYAKQLDDTDYFGDDLKAVLVEYQTRMNASNPGLNLRTDGVLDYATQKALGMVAPPSPPPKVGTLFTVQGTGVDMWTGYPADVARAVEADWEWQPIGNYPADPFPMWQSILKGIAELRVQLRRHNNLTPGRKIALAGYSQGGIVVSWVFKHDIVDPKGQLHDLLPYVVAAVTWGNPMREQGKANGNQFANWVVPEGRGILYDRLENTPDFWLDFAHGANSEWGRDMYTDVEPGARGDDESAICDVVMMQTLWSGPLSVLKRLVSLSQNPMVDGIALIMAVYDAGMFFGRGTGPHVNYDINPAIDYLRGVARSLRAAAA